MSHAPRICIVGSSNMDLTFRTPRLPRPGETVAGEALPAGFGGKGANQAVMAARLGAQVAMVSRVGKDSFGEQIVGNFRAHGIETTHVRVDLLAPTGVAVILVDQDARNCIVVAPGANHRLTPADVVEATPAIQSARVLLVQLEVPVETTLEAFRIARAAAVTTVLNPAPAAALPDELLQLTDLCVPNETELELLSGDPDVKRAAHALRRRGPTTVIVTLGERGALVVADGLTQYVPSVPVRAVDPTGAGDAFIGSLAVFLAEGLALAEAVRRANGVAALSVTRAGAQASFPSRQEIV